jgi:hypothetical protein
MQARVGLVQTVGDGIVDIKVGARREDDLGVFWALGERMAGGKLGPKVRFNSLGRLLGWSQVWSRKPYC